MSTEVYNGPLPTYSAEVEPQLDGSLRQVVKIAEMPSISIDKTGLATEAKQDTQQTTLDAINGKITACDTGHVTVDALPAGLATSANQTTGNNSLASIDGKIVACDTTNLATAAKQDTGNTSLNSIDTKLTDVASHTEQVNQTSILNDIKTNTGGGGGSVSVVDLFLALRSILNAILRPIWVTRTGYARVLTDTGSSLGTVTTVTTVTGVTNIGGQSAYLGLVRPAMRMNWGRNVRSLIS